MRRLIRIALVIALLLTLVPAWPASADNYEPNDTLSSATSLTIGSTINSYISKNTDVDYFKFVPSTSGTLTVTLAVPTGQDYDPKLLDADGNILKSGYEGIGVTDKFDYEVTGSTTYYIEVLAYANRYSSATNPYSLTTSLKSTGTGPTCTKDTYESNGSRTAAKTIGTNFTAKGLISCDTTDVDYFKVVPTSTGSLHLRLDVPTTVDYDLDLVDSSGNRLKVGSAGKGLPEDFSYDVTAANTYYIKVWSFSGWSDTNYYTLTTSFTATPTDNYEPNNSTAEPKAINPNTFYSSYIFTATDVDYYSFVVPTGKPLVGVTMTPPSDRDYDLDLLDSSGNLVQSNHRGAGQVESIWLNLTEGSKYYLKVCSVSNRYSTSKTYSLMYSVGPQDNYEPNNTTDHAYEIQPGTTYTSKITTTTDNDYYKIVPTSDSSINITMTPPSTSDFDLVLLNPNGAELARSKNRKRGGTETIQFALGKGSAYNSYFIKVFGYAGAADANNTYSLSATLTALPTINLLTPNGNDTLRGTVTLSASVFNPPTTMTKVGFFWQDSSHLLDSVSSSTNPWSTTVDTLYSTAGYGLLFTKGLDSTGKWVLDGGSAWVTIDKQVGFLSPDANVSIKGKTTLIGRSNYALTSGEFHYILNGADTLITKVSIASDLYATYDWTPPPGLTGTGTLRFVGKNSAGITRTQDLPVTFNVPSDLSDPFFAAIPATPPASLMQSGGWVETFNEKVAAKWILPNGTHITGSWRNSAGKQRGCSPDEEQTADCYARLQLTQTKLNTLWSTARTRKQDPRLYLAILFQEGTGSFNSRPPCVPCGESPNGNLYDINWQRDLNGVANKLIPQKIRAYGMANAFRQQAPNSNLFPYLGWYTPIDRNNGESGLYAADFNWYQGIQVVYDGLTDGQSSAYSDYVIRQAQAKNPEFTATTISSSAVWSSNTTAYDGPRGVQYQIEVSGAWVDYPAPPHTVWWLSRSEPRGIIVSPKNAYTVPLGTTGETEVVGDYVANQYDIVVPDGWIEACTESQDLCTYTSPMNNGPVIRVYQLPGSDAVTGIDEMNRFWAFKDRQITALDQPNGTTLFRAEGINPNDANEWTGAVGMETADGFVKFVYVTCPASDYAQWTSVIDATLSGYHPSSTVWW